MSFLFACPGDNKASILLGRRRFEHTGWSALDAVSFEI